MPVNHDRYLQLKYKVAKLNLEQTVFSLENHLGQFVVTLILELQLFRECRVGLEIPVHLKKHSVAL